MTVPRSDTGMSSRNVTWKALLVRGLSNGAFIALVLLVAVFMIYAAAATGALSIFSLTNLLNASTTLVVAAVGLTLVILTGGYDLSVGGVMVLSNVIISSRGGHGGGTVVIDLALVMTVGLLIGLINGYMVGYLGVQSIAATLATMIMADGIALVVQPAPGGNVPGAIAYGFTSSMFGVIPVAALIVILFLIAWLVFRRTPFVKWIYAIGADERAASQVKIPVPRVKMFTYGLAGLIYGLAGFMLSAQIASGDPTTSTSFVMLVFAAVAIGGTAFGGGRGGVVGSIIGAGILTILQKMLFAVGASSFFTYIFEGAILIVAVLIGVVSNLIGKRVQI